LAVVIRLADLGELQKREYEIQKQIKQQKTTTTKKQKQQHKKQKIKLK